MSSGSAPQHLGASSSLFVFLSNQLLELNRLFMGPQLRLRHRGKNPLLSYTSSASSTVLQLTEKEIEELYTARKTNQESVQTKRGGNLEAIYAGVLVTRTPEERATVAGWFRTITTCGGVNGRSDKELKDAVKFLRMDVGTRYENEKLLLLYPGL
jgi:hypothetical protein